MLDDYGLNKEDFMETLKDMQFLINGDSMLKGKLISSLVFLFMEFL